MSCKDKSDVFIEEEKIAVWEKAKEIPHIDSTQFRMDMCGAIIHFPSYGAEHEFGWEIDHIYPKDLIHESKCHLRNDLRNLQALQYQNNRNKSNHFPYFDSMVSSNDGMNEEYVTAHEIDIDLSLILEAMYSK